MTLRIAVTGASGFVGTNLIPYLHDNGYDVQVLKRDLTESLDGVDAVVHLAGVAEREATDAQCNETNQLTSDLLEHCRFANVKHFIFVSSIAAQAGTFSEHISTETDIPRPTSQYGRAKLEAEHIVSNSGLPFTILRPVAISGPNLKGNLALLQKIARLPIPLPLAGLRAKRSIVSINNFNRAAQTVLTNPAAKGEIFIVADPISRTVSEIVSLYRVEAGKSPNIFYFPPTLMRLLFKAAGRQEMWERLDGQLIADSTKLMSIGCNLASAAPGIRCRGHRRSKRLPANDCP
jgi:UDP-glucose 4-epimerase